MDRPIPTRDQLLELGSLAAELLDLDRGMQSTRSLARRLLDEMDDDRQRASRLAGRLEFLAMALDPDPRAQPEGDR